MDGCLLIGATRALPESKKQVVMRQILDIRTHYAIVWQWSTCYVLHKISGGFYWTLKDHYVLKFLLLKYKTRTLYVFAECLRMQATHFFDVFSCCFSQPLVSSHCCMTWKSIIRLWKSYLNCVIHHSECQSALVLASITLLLHCDGVFLHIDFTRLHSMISFCDFLMDMNRD